MRKLNFCTFLIIYASLLQGCSLSVNITDMNQKDIEAKPSNEHSGSDFQAGETIVTTTNVTVRGIFGETSEWQVLNNGVEIKGAFYE